WDDRTRKVELRVRRIPRMNNALYFNRCRSNVKTQTQNRTEGQTEIETLRRMTNSRRIQTQTKNQTETRTERRTQTHTRTEDQTENETQTEIETDLQIIYYGLHGLEALSHTGELSSCWYILLSGSVFIDGSMFLPTSRAHSHQNQQRGLLWCYHILKTMKTRQNHDLADRPVYCGTAPHLVEGTNWVHMFSKWVLPDPCGLDPTKTSPSLTNIPLHSRIDVFLIPMARCHYCVPI
ncbi:unnamed protein product, partial [Nesidiocoris tenuis]